MGSLGIDAGAQRAIWRALACVLSLGNVELTSETEREAGEAAALADAPLPLSPEAPGGSSGGPRALLNPQAATLSKEGDSARAVAAVTSLLGVTPQQLGHALTHRTITRWAARPPPPSSRRPRRAARATAWPRPSTSASSCTWWAW